MEIKIVSEDVAVRAVASESCLRAQSQSDRLHLTLGRGWGGVVQCVATSLGQR